jgi:hypothetical protein
VGVINKIASAVTTQQSIKNNNKNKIEVAELQYLLKEYNR